MKLKTICIHEDNIAFFIKNMCNQLKCTMFLKTNDISKELHRFISDIFIKNNLVFYSKHVKYLSDEEKIALKNFFNRGGKVGVIILCSKTGIS